MNAGYYSTAWNDIKSTPKWLSKMFLLALIQLIPIFGSIVVNGYLYGWARDVAWGVRGPLPAKIFGNEDGKLYSRGFFVIVLGFVLGLVPAALYFLYMLASGVGTYSFLDINNNAPNFGAYAGFSALGMVFYILYYVMLAIVAVVQWVGSMRISIYGTLSSGFQLKKIWAMLRHDFLGILKIIGMVLITSLIWGMIIGAVFTILFFVFLAISIAAVGGSYSSVSGSFDSSIVGFILAFGGISVVLFLIVYYVALVGGTWIEALMVRALGYWTMQFDVPSWRGQDDPMPFQLVPNPQSASAPYQAPPPSYPTQGPAGAPQGPGGAPQAYQPPQGVYPYGGQAPQQGAQPYQAPGSPQGGYPNQATPPQGGQWPQGAQPYQATPSPGGEWPQGAQPYQVAPPQGGQSWQGQQQVPTPKGESGTADDVTTMLSPEETTPNTDPGNTKTDK